MRPVGWLNAAAVATWLACGVSPILAMMRGPFAAWSAAVWIAAYVLFGAALLTLLYHPHKLSLPPLNSGYALLRLAVQSVAGLTMTFVAGAYLGGTGPTSATLVIVAAELPHCMTPGRVWSWIGVQTVLLMLLFSRAASPAEILGMGIAIGGFQLFAAASSFLARSEAVAREKLAAANAELLATRGLLAESSRNAERLRISRDLHDTLGHHLTALSLQLDVASRLADGKAAGHVQQAHAITRLLLSDVRDVVGQLRSRRLDLAESIRRLAAESRALAIHLDLPDVLEIEEGAQADALLKCVQEIITNTTRHAGACNLWIHVEPNTDGIALHARDDGRGAGALALGNGLTGMRERFEEYAGRVEFRAVDGRGFEVHGFMPRPGLAS